MASGGKSSSPVSVMYSAIRPVKFISPPLVGVRVGLLDLVGLLDADVDAKLITPGANWQFRAGDSA